MAIQVFDKDGNLKGVGKTGPEGISAYDVAVNNGFVGTEAAWLASLIGATGTSGGSYTFTQAVPASTWNVTHSLGYFPNVSVVDSANSVVIGGIQHIDSNNLTLTFSAAFSGKAYLS